MVTAHSIEVVRRARRYTLISGLSSGINFVVHENNLMNLRRGLVERVFLKDGKPPPMPRRDIFKNCDSFAEKLIHTIGKVHRTSTKEFVDSSPVQKRKLYARVALELQVKPLERSDACLSTFVKCEKINLSDKPDPAPRVIQPRNPRYNVAVGRWFRPMEHRIYRAIADVYGGPTVMKGYNASQTASHIRDMWDEFDDPVGVGLDASRFDQHVSVDALQWEHSVYLRLVPKSERKKFAEYLTWQVQNKGKARAKDGSVQYEVMGRRMSGDMNTALGNCLLMCALVHTFMGGIKHRLANNGDDCMVICERKDLVRFQKCQSWFLTYGFNMKMEDPVHVFEDIEFCQCHPVLVGGYWRMVRNLRTSLSKDAIVPRPFDSVAAIRKHLSTLGECGLAIGSGVPVIQAYYKALLRHGSTSGTHEVCGMSNMAKGMLAVESTVDDSTRHSFWLAFGITPDHQLLLEKEFESLTLDFSSDIVVPASISTYYANL